jgi:hypothetical protein
MQGGTHVNAMSEKICGFANDKEADAKAVAPFWMEAGEGIKQSRLHRIGDANAGVEHVDSHGRADTAATDKYPPTAIGILDGVAHQVAENNAEKQRITENGCSRPNDANGDVFAGGGFSILMTGLPQQGIDGDGPKLNPPNPVVKKKSGQQLFELLGHPVNCGLTQFEQLQLRFGANAATERVVRVLHHLERLSEIVRRGGQEYGREV